MDTIFHFFHNLQTTHKPLSMRFYSLFTSIAHTFRLLQLCTSLLLLYWILTRLSFLLQISCIYFHTLTSLFSSPLFVFLISNAIIVSLFANSRRIIGQISDGGRNVEIDLFCEFTKQNADNHAESTSEFDFDGQSRREAEQMDCQDKQIVSDNTIDRTIRDQVVEFHARTETDSVAEIIESECPKVYRRSQSENLEGESGKEVTQNLRRSETARICENARENLFAHDKLSNEEFQRTIEAFIARQMRFLREESLAIVVRKQS